MFTHDYIEPYQVNSFVYCKRKWFYQNRLKLFIYDNPLDIGKYIHENHWLEKYKYKEIYLISQKWKLKGICDYIVKENHQKIPLELKSGRSKNKKPFKNDVMQLLCYLLLLEDNFEGNFKYGYLLYVSSKQKIKVTVTKSLKSELVSYLTAIRALVRCNKMPTRQKHKSYCSRCSYNEFCWCE